LADRTEDRRQILAGMHGSGRRNLRLEGPFITVPVAGWAVLARRVREDAKNCRNIINTGD
jgi:hypothetical protein